MCRCGSVLTLRSLCAALGHCIMDMHVYCPARLAAAKGSIDNCTRAPLRIGAWCGERARRPAMSASFCSRRAGASADPASLPPSAAHSNRQASGPQVARAAAVATSWRHAANQVGGSRLGQGGGGGSIGCPPCHVLTSAAGRDGSGQRVKASRRSTRAACCRLLQHDSLQCSCLSPPMPRMASLFLYLNDNTIHPLCTPPRPPICQPTNPPSRTPKPHRSVSSGQTWPAIWVCHPHSPATVTRRTALVSQ